MKRQICLLSVLILSMFGNSFVMSFTIKEEARQAQVFAEEKRIEEQKLLLEKIKFEAMQSGDIFKIPVLEYHNIGEEEARWTRSYDNFYNDLLWLYNNDYRPVTVQQFITMDFQLEIGEKPFLLTFDDASASQFRYLEDGTIDPNCAVGIMDGFISEYPDFGSSATFFVLPYSFGQSNSIDKKLKYLIETGREIGNHTFGHESLDELDAEGIQKTLAENQKYVQEILGSDYKVQSLAYPLGIYPDGDLFEYIKKGIYDGNLYEINAAFLVGAQPSLLPVDANFDAYKIPRIQAIEDEWKRHFNREPGETEKTEKKPNFSPYVIGAPVDFIPSENITQPSEEVVPEEPKYPYELCNPADFTPRSKFANFWKSFEFRTKIAEKNNIPSELVKKQGRYFYTIQDGDGSLAEKFLSYSSHFRVGDFKNAILAANSGKDFVIGDEVVIPDIPEYKINFFAPEHNLWGIYLTGYYAVSDEGMRLVDELKSRGGRLLVFDVKEIDGDVYYPSNVQMVKDIGADKRITIPDLGNYVRAMHAKGLYLAARMVIFKDIRLANARPDLAIHDINGNVWNSSEGQTWLDPSNEETQNYIMDLAEEVAKSGVDEIQFDYIRFPTQGNVNSTKYNFDETVVEKYEVIRNFMARVKDRIAPYGTKLSMDVYGVIVWNNAYDSQSTGQRMECLGQYIDVVYPMIYPSHFGPGFAGFANPADSPEYFVSESIRLFNQYLAGTSVKIRPWLQAFAWRVSDYGWWYVNAQVKAAHETGVDEYALWNAGNVYFTE
ncbi:polysaccharide deacetylase family protein [Candidatus Peregrinibacteria bacterium]|nr:polysaccharide deacetylase family protein [Candidatus Peregrinibacteria bacterium]